MKNIIVKTLLTASFVASFTSCSLNDDWLSLNDPNRETANTFWKTTKQFDQGLSAAYSTWRRPGYFSRWFQVLMILRSDEGWSESPNTEFQADANFIISAYNYDGNAGISLPWQTIYNSLYYVNQVIDNMNSTGYKLFSKEEADHILGQGYFYTWRSILVYCGYLWYRTNTNKLYREWTYRHTRRIIQTSP